MQAGGLCSHVEYSLGYAYRYSLIKTKSRANMILSFKPKFVDPIKAGSKIHTIREDKPNRWHAGRPIQYATGVRTKNYKEFNSGICRSVQFIRIKWIDKIVSVEIGSIKTEMKLIYFFNPSDEKVFGMIEKGEMKELSLNDGFESIEAFFKWFDKDFEGKIIHWTNHKY